jgi:hypothetical protein
MPPIILSSPSQLALALSLTIYPLIFLVSLPRHATPIQYIATREALSLAHCTLMTILTVWTLYQYRTIIYPSPSSHGEFDLHASRNGAALPLITTRSPLLNTLTAVETGYLLQDSVVLYLGVAFRRREANAGRTVKLRRELNLAVVGYHHAGLSLAFVVLQWYVGHGKERGVLVIVMLMLMNASTPVGTGNWFVTNFCPGWKRVVRVLSAAYLVVYAVVRVGILWWVLGVFGAQMGLTAWRAYAGLRVPCMLGTTAMGMANALWLAMGLRTWARRYLWGKGGIDGARKGV